MVIFPVTYKQLLDDPQCDVLLAEYADECSLPELGMFSPQRDLYERMEAFGSLECFGVHEGAALVGFISLITYVLPHYGKLITTTESIFLSKRYPSGRSGLKMLNFIEDFARAKGSISVLYTAPVGSRFSALLSKRKKCRHSNNVFVRAL